MGDGWRMADGGWRMADDVLADLTTLPSTVARRRSRTVEILFFE
jgi:hypothetical protein